MDIEALLSNSSSPVESSTKKSLAPPQEMPTQPNAPMQPKFQLPPLSRLYNSKPLLQRNMGHGLPTSSVLHHHPFAIHRTDVNAQSRPIMQLPIHPKAAGIPSRENAAISRPSSLHDIMDSQNKDRLAPEVMRALLRWLVDHADNPYPSDQEKRDLQLKYNLNTIQINNWFINARRRVLRKLVKMNLLDHPEVVDIAEKMVRRGRRPKSEAPIMSTRMAEQQGDIRFSASRRRMSNQRMHTPPINSTPASSPVSLNPAADGREQEALDVLASLATQNKT